MNRFVLASLVTTFFATGCAAPAAEEEQVEETVEQSSEALLLVPAPWESLMRPALSWRAVQRAQKPAPGSFKASTVRKVEVIFGYGPYESTAEIGACRAWWWGAQHAGFYMPETDTCSFGYGGKTIDTDRFELLYGDRHDALSWQPWTGTAPTNAVLAGQENGENRFVCRARLVAPGPNGPQPIAGSGGYFGYFVGKTVGPHCNIADGVHERLSTDFEILTAKSRAEILFNP
jgi:hypothetical protein